MPVLLPEIVKQQEKMERELARQRRGEVGQTRQDEVVEWLIERLKADNPEIDEPFTRPCEYQCWSFEDYIMDYKHGYFPDIPEAVWRFWSAEEMVWSLWIEDDEWWLIYDDNGKFLNMSDIQHEFPIWKGKEKQWFKEHPCKDKFYLVKFNP